MLHTIAELRQNFVRHVDRNLGHEIDADALGADQAHHLLDLVGERLGRVVEQKMRLVEEEHELGLLRIAHLGKLLEQLREQPQQKCRIEPRVLHQLVGGKQADDALAVARAHQVLDVERRLAEEFFGVLVVEHEQLALDGADRGRGDVAVFLGQRCGILGDEGEHRPQILQIEQ